MTFEIDDDSGGLGVLKTVDLLRGSGAQRKVLTRGDVNHYIVLVTRYWMFDRIQHHIEHIRLGINDVVPLDFFNMFNSTELQTLLSGSEAAIDVADWRENCSYHGFSGPDDPVLSMFWTIVEEFSAEERSRLLHYVTSCSRPPLLGFAALNPGFSPANILPPHAPFAHVHHTLSGFQIQRLQFRRGAAVDAGEFLPMAATCMNILKLPAYADIGACKRAVVGATLILKSRYHAHQATLRYELKLGVLSRVKGTVRGWCCRRSCWCKSGVDVGHAGAIRDVERVGRLQCKTGRLLREQNKYFGLSQKTLGVEVATTAGGTFRAVQTV